MDKFTCRTRHLALLWCGLPGCHLHVWRGLLHPSPACLGVVSLICHHCAWAWPAWPFLVSVWPLQPPTAALPVNSGRLHPVLGCFRMGSTLEGQDWEGRLAGRGPGRSSDLHTLGLPPGEGRWPMGRGLQSRVLRSGAGGDWAVPHPPAPSLGARRGDCVSVSAQFLQGERSSLSCHPGARPPALPWSLSFTSLPGGHALRLYFMFSAGWLLVSRAGLVALGRCCMGSAWLSRGCASPVASGTPMADRWGPPLDMEVSAG